MRAVSHLLLSQTIPRGMGSYADYPRNCNISNTTIHSLKRAGYPSAVSKDTSNCSYLSSILMRHSWYFCTAMQSISKKKYSPETSVLVPSHAMQFVSSATQTLSRDLTQTFMHIPQGALFFSPPHTDTQYTKCRLGSLKPPKTTQYLFIFDGNSTKM